MNTIAQWQENNALYLSRSLAWLRLRLARLARTAPLEESKDLMNESQQAERPGRENFPGENPAPAAAMISDDDVGGADRAMTEAARFEPPPKTEAQFSSSTRPTPSSASAARSETAMTAKPTSRSSTPRMSSQQTNCLHFLVQAMQGRISSKLS